MAINYTWKITSVSKTNDEGLENVIIGTRWECEGTDTADNISGKFIGATPFQISSVNPDTFINYSELTEEKVLGWIKNAVSGSSTSYWDHITERIEKDIKSKRNIVTNVDNFDLPWAPTSGSYTGSKPI